MNFLSASTVGKMYHIIAIGIQHFSKVTSYRGTMVGFCYRGLCGRGSRVVPNILFICDVL